MLLGDLCYLLVGKLRCVGHLFLSKGCVSSAKLRVEKSAVQCGLLSGSSSLLQQIANLGGVSIAVRQLSQTVQDFPKRKSFLPQIVDNGLQNLRDLVLSHQFAKANRSFL